MRRRMCVLAGIVLGVPLLAAAQMPDSSPMAPSDSIFLRARQLVSEGRGATGRAIVDSVLATRPEGSGPYAEALFWRASLAATAADAERDYRRLAVEFPMSARSEDALLRLAQMELARGDRAMAVKHLERLTLEHQTATARPRASYWMARILFENGDLRGGCTALASARATVAAADVELRNEVSYLSRRCAGVAIARTDSAVPVPAPSAGPITPPVPTPVPAAPTEVASAVPAVPTPATPSPFNVLVPEAAATSLPATAPPGVPADSARLRPRADTVGPAVRAPPPSPETQPVFVAATSVIPEEKGSVTPPVTAPSNAPATTPVDTAPAATAPSRPPVDPVDPVAAKPAPATRALARPAARPAAARFTVQVAAYDSRPPAEKMAATLVRAGWEARVSGSDRPFRVRVGRYATRAEAVAAAKALAAKKIGGFVTEAEP